MYSFKSDYSEGAHPQILKRLVETNLEQSEGYGMDTYSEEAKSVMKKKLGNDNVDIHFIMGGTQTNLLAISSFLRPYEAAISAKTGHILANETGAIEATGHKIIEASSKDGKLRAEDVVEVLKKYTNEHVVKPRLVYISNSTEIGTIYKKEELRQLNEVCKKNDLLLYMDGARLGSALMCKDNDLTLEDISNLVDAFYIGGTKHGLLLGEALVIVNDSLKRDFRYNLKQRGAMLAKGRVLGIQFLELFKEELFNEIGMHENKMADILRDEIKALGFEFLVESPSNQVFPILDNYIINKLQSNYAFSMWEKIDENRTAIRLVTSFATQEEFVNAFINELKECVKK